MSQIAPPIPQKTTTEDYAYRFRISRFELKHLPIEVVQNEIEKMEKEAIYRAVKQTSGWISIKPELLEHTDIMDDMVEYQVRVHVRPVTTKIYVFEDYSAAMRRDPTIPKDLHNCHWCGGHTKNDMRGHCAGCGGPRKHYTWEGESGYDVEH